jgi:hypothetical protein
MTREPWDGVKVLTFAVELARVLVVLLAAFGLWTWLW